MIASVSEARIGGTRGFFSILSCSQTSDHPQKDSAKFGYTPGMKGFKILRILHIVGYMLKPQSGDFSKKNC
jgi:hypothetical protein